ncbi:heparan-alpha-glucosaminide N-acetyltransferase [Methanothermobacter sp.]|uniref:heparan-alpha-glucosaminide N-acetyltransferase n=1 Tax=Methanothermobacter sp. TaxID=1884223 RepID=UPI00260D1332|nr:heparan-alpha-glucosaminide N-acetyltransferase [Methanothermobacter sp.]MDI9614200.1 heparan-alpha-glucosaminide N-acetyltransferase [Methanothermobacter sp.]
MGVASSRERFHEVDAMRGIAVVMMIIYHVIFDLNFLGAVKLDMTSPLIWITGRLTSFLFIFLVGVSLSLSHSRRGSGCTGHYIKRGIRIFLYGLLITAVTWIYPHEGFIVFGMLHFIGAAVIITYPFAGRRLPSVIGALLALAAGVWVSGLRADTLFFVWLGLKPPGFYTLDYFPLLPWIGVVLLGIFTGDTLYPGYRRRWKGELQRRNHTLEFLGKNSLAIYFIHQPVILAVIWLLMNI